MTCRGADPRVERASFSSEDVMLNVWQRLIEGVSLVAAIVTIIAWFAK
jgi:hypothetical protein